MNSSSGCHVKLVAATVGGCALLLAVGAGSLGSAQHSDGQVNAAGATVGAVPAPTTTTTPPVYGVPPVVSAAPVMKGKAPYFPGQSPNHTPQ